MTARAETWTWLAQRASAAVLACCVAVHLVTMIIAARSGLSAVEILGRTRGSIGWLVFYAVFVAAVAIHAPIGLRTIAAEWLQWRGRRADAACAIIGVALLGLGLRAVFAVTL